MKALSVKQPWAELEISGVKPIENRSWYTNHRGDLLIHASMSSTTLEEGQWLLDHGIVVESSCRRGAIIGVVRVVNVVRIDVFKQPSIFAHGPWCWVLENPRRFAEPVPYMGRLGLFDVVDPRVTEQLRS